LVFRAHGDAEVACREVADAQMIPADSYGTFIPY
jgi:hypothetical protein